MQTRPAPPTALAPAVPGFELGERIGIGATSEVWAAVRESDGRRVAVKVVHADLDEVDAAAREAALSAVAASAHVVRVEACLPLEDGRVALVMPWLQGGSLGDLVAARGHLEPGEVVTVLAPVASALARLHGVGVVHADVSPGNVLLDVDGRPHLADLGLGHVLGEESHGVWGSDGYVAPEVVLGSEPTAAADVYSLGALGWLCLTGSVPAAPGLRPGLVDVALAEASPGRTALIGALDRALDPDAAQRPDADALAWSLFEAATATPIHLVSGEDEVSAITYRLRAAAGGDGERGDLAAATQPGRVARLRARAGASSSGLMGRVRDAVRRGQRIPRTRRGAHRDHASARRPSGPGGMLIWGVACGAMVLAVLGAVALIWLGPWSGGRGPASRASSVDAAEARSTPGTPTPQSGQRSDAVGDPRLDADAPTTRPSDLIAALADARADAWRSGSPLLLREVDAPESTAWVRDMAAVTELKRSGIRYTDLRHDVAEARMISAAKDRAVVRARIDTSAYLVASRTSRESRPASFGVPVLISLVRTEEGWRVSDISGEG
ncbi:MAG: serine/threonine-protein kinase [Ornithinibacter sp.]